MYYRRICHVFAHHRWRDIAEISDAIVGYPICQSRRTQSSFSAELLRSWCVRGRSTLLGDLFPTSSLASSSRGAEHDLGAISPASAPCGRGNGKGDASIPRRGRCRVTRLLSHFVPLTDASLAPRVKLSNLNMGFHTLGHNDSTRSAVTDNASS